MEDFVTHDEELDNRFVTLENGNKIHIKRTEPHGFWKINYDKGQIPISLQGLYTSYNTALNAVTQYVKERDIALKKIEEEKKTEKVSTKKS